MLALRLFLTMALAFRVFWTLLEVEL